MDSKISGTGVYGLVAMGDGTGVRSAGSLVVGGTG